VTRIPVVVGFHLPAAFREAVHREERDGVEYVIEIGAAQTAGFGRLMNALFTRSVAVSSPDAAAATDRGDPRRARAGARGSLVRDAGATRARRCTRVSLKYRINAYRPNGEFVDSWSFTGYGTQAGSSVPGQGKGLLQKAAAVAMRDAGAKIAVEMREQAIVRGLIEAPEGSRPGEIQPPP